MLKIAQYKKKANIEREKSTWETHTFYLSRILFEVIQEASQLTKMSIVAFKKNQAQQDHYPHADYSSEKLEIEQNWKLKPIFRDDFYKEEIYIKGYKAIK